MRTRIYIIALAALLGLGVALGGSYASFVPAPSAATVDSNWIVPLGPVTSGTGTEVQLGGATQVAVEYEISTGTTAGVVVLEHSAVSGYTGTWAELDSETVGTSFATAPSKVVFTYPGPLGFIRPRVTTTFSGGATPRITVRVKRMFGQ